MTTTTTFIKGAVSENLLPRYHSRKFVVRGALIHSALIEPESGDTILVLHVDDGFYSMKVTDGYVHKHKPQPGGYYVLYEDGYESWSPGHIFEADYTRI